MATLLDLFAQNQRRRNLSPNTIGLRDRQLKLYEKEIGKPIGQATRDSINAFLDGRLTKSGEPISAKTRSCYLTTFSAYFEWLNEEGEETPNPITKSMRPKVKAGMPNPIPEKALEKAIAQTYELRGTKANPDRGPQMRAWLQLAARAGLRAMEISKLTVEDVDYETNRITITGKGGKTRRIPISKDVKKALSELSYTPESGRFFPTTTPASVSQKSNRYLHGLGIQHSLHKGRHRFGTQFYSASGNDILQTQRVLGHSSPATTANYADVDDEEAQTAILAI